MSVGFSPLILDSTKNLQRNLLISLFQCISHISFHYLIETKIKKSVKQIYFILIHKFNHKLDKI